MNLEDITLSEITPTEKDTSSHLYVKSKKVKALEPESTMVVSRVWGIGEMGQCWSNGANFQL